MGEAFPTLLGLTGRAHNVGDTTAPAECPIRGRRRPRPEQQTPHNNDGKTQHRLLYYASATTTTTTSFRLLTVMMPSTTQETGSCDDGVCIPKGTRQRSNNDGTSHGGMSTSGAGSTRDSATADRKIPIEIEIISDTMCPWCWVGKRNLETALRESPDIEADVEWLPYFLDRDLPEEGKPVEEYYRDNYGDPEAGSSMKPHLVAAGKKCGIDFEKHYVKMTRYRPTIKSHRLIEYTKERNMQNEMVEELFRMYYEEGKDLNSVEDLVESAKRIGLEGEGDDDEIRAFLLGDEKEDDIDRKAGEVRSLAHGVPTFLFRRTDRPDLEATTFSGGQPPAAFRRVFDYYRNS